MRWKYLLFQTEGTPAKGAGQHPGPDGLPRETGTFKVVECICDTTQIIPFPSLKTLSAWWLRFQKKTSPIPVLVAESFDYKAVGAHVLGKWWKPQARSKLSVSQGKLQSGVDRIIWAVSGSCSAWQLSCRGCCPGKPQLVCKSQVIATAPASGLPPRPLSGGNVVFWAPERKGFCEAWREKL